MAAKDTAPKKEYTKHVAVVVEMKHGRFFSKHSHYMVSVVEVPVSMSRKTVGEAMQESLNFAGKLGVAKGKELKLLTSQEVEVISMADRKERSENFSLFSALRKLVN